MSTTIQELRDLIRELVVSQQDTDARFKETDQRFKETDKRIQKAVELFESQWGKLVESLVEGDVVNILRQRGIDVHDTSTRRKGKHNGQNYEFDIIAHNHDEIVVIEVKTTLRVQHVRHFIEKLRHVRTWLQEYRNYKVYGAVAFLRAEEASDIHAENERLFVIRATGNSAAIVNGEGFVARVF